MVLAPAQLDRTTLQRKVVRTLVGSQILGGVGMACGIAVGALLAEDLSGTEALAGVGTTAQVLGTALLTIPVARATAARGRRVGLRWGLAVAFVGAALVLVAAVLRSFPLFVVGMFLFGGGTTANNQARYAAADLAAPLHRGRDLSIVVWATTIGSVAGPNLVGPGKALAHRLGLPGAGRHVPLLARRLRARVARRRPAAATRPAAHRPRARRRGAGREPTSAAALDRDRRRRRPAGRRRRAGVAGPAEAPNHDGSMRRGLAVVRGNPRALQAMLVMALGHLVMVSVMVMTPIHMKHGHAELEVIGFVISVHILGMFALSPLVGAAVDRWGAAPVAMTGGVILTLAALLAVPLPGGLVRAAARRALPARRRLVVHARVGLDPAHLGRHDRRAPGDPGSRRRAHGAGGRRGWRGGRRRGRLARLLRPRQRVGRRRRRHPRGRCGAREPRRG